MHPLKKCNLFTQQDARSSWCRGMRRMLEPTARGTHGDVETHIMKLATKSCSNRGDVSLDCLLCWSGHKQAGFCAWRRVGQCHTRGCRKVRSLWTAIVSSGCGETGAGFVLDCHKASPPGHLLRVWDIIFPWVLTKSQPWLFRSLSAQPLLRPHFSLRKITLAK